MFKTFESHVEKEVDSLIRCLRTDHGQSLPLMPSPIFTLIMVFVSN